MEATTQKSLKHDLSIPPKAKTMEYKQSGLEISIGGKMKF